MCYATYIPRCREPGDMYVSELRGGGVVGGIVGIGRRGQRCDVAAYHL